MDGSVSGPAGRKGPLTNLFAYAPATVPDSACGASGMTRLRGLSLSSPTQRSGDRFLVIPDAAKRRSLSCHPRRSEAEIAFLSSPTQRSGDRFLVIPDAAKRRSLSCHPRRSEAEIGDGTDEPQSPPGQPAGLSRETGRRHPGGARSHRPFEGRPSPGSALRAVRAWPKGGLVRPRSPLRCVGDDKEAISASLRRG